MRAFSLVAALVVLAASASVTYAQPADPDDDGLGTAADFSRVTVGPLPEHPDASVTDALLAAHPEDASKHGITLISAIDTRSHLYPVYEQLTRYGGLMQTLSYVGSWLDLPADLRVIFGECRQLNAFYAPRHHAIVFCYELVASFAEYFRDQLKLSGPALGRAVVGATVFSLLHELGHAFSDLYGFPMLGNEEDSADRIAALLLLEEGDVGTSRAYAGAVGFLSLDDGSRPAWFDEHSAGPQRFHNVMCLLVGADPANLALVTDENFKAHRAPRCPMEFAKARASLDVLLLPHYKKAVKPSRLALLQLGADPQADPYALPPLLVVTRARIAPAPLAAPAGGWPDVVAWKLAHLEQLVSLLEQSEADLDGAARDVTLHYLHNHADLGKLAAAATAASEADLASANKRHEAARAEVRKRLIALSRRSPALWADARVSRALSALL